MTTIHDVAKLANVSISTVSRVLNNSTLVTPDKKERVLRVIEELGYQPNGLARGLIHKRTKTIGVLITDVSSFFFAEVVRGMEDIAHALGWNVIICNTDGDPERMLKYIDVLKEKRVDGVIFTSEPISEKYYQALNSLSIPVVLAATSSKYPFPWVKVNDRQASFEAIQFLIENGHREIGMVSGPIDDPIAGIPRFEGFREALEAHNLSFQPDRVFHGDFRFDSGKQAIEFLLKRHPNITAIFAASDEMALGVYSYAYEKEIRIPDDLSVIGYDNVRIARMMTPPLTTVAQPLYEIGETAVGKLIEKITDPSAEIANVYMQYEVLDRGSVKKMNL